MRNKIIPLFILAVPVLLGSMAFKKSSDSGEQPGMFGDIKMYLRFGAVGSTIPPDFEGNSMENGYNKWLELGSYNLAANSSAYLSQSNGLTAGTATGSAIGVEILSASIAIPSLYIMACNQDTTVIKNAVIDVGSVATGSFKKIERLELDGVMITDLSVSANAVNPGQVNYNMSLNYKILKRTYYVYDPNTGAESGNVDFLWNYNKNEANN